MKFLTNLTLGKKITFLTALGLALGVAVFSSIGMRAVNQATETMLEDRLTTAHLLADHVDEALEHALSQLEYTARIIETNGTNNLESEIEALEDAYSRLSVYTHGIYVLNDRGQLIWSKPEVPRSESMNISSNPSINQTIRTGYASISGLVSAPMTDSPVIFLASQINASQGSKGALVVAIDIAQSSIGGFVKPLRLGQTGYVEIVDQNGIVVARTEPGPKLAAFEKSDHSGRFAALISAGKPTRGVCHTCHEQTVQKKDVLAFIPLSTASWGVVIRQSEEEALAPIGELKQSLLLFGVVLVSIALLFVTITTRDVGSRIRMLTAASRRIAEGDLISPVPAAGKDEVAVLAHTFDDMRVKLKISYNELEQKTKEAEQAKALREADRLKSEFISSVSHELRTPLTLIKGYSTSLLRQDASWDREVQQEFLQIIDEKTDELRDMIDKLLQSAKLEAGALKLEKEPVLLPRLARKVIEDTESKAKKHKFRLEFAPSFPVVEADVRCMEQVLRNLVQNAIKYSPQGGEIVIAGEVKDGKVLVSVSDEGIGIPPEHQSKVFERFYRIDSPLTRGIPGSGLGLSITKGHIEAHGGEVWLESKVGKGSKFYFSLPLEQDERSE